MWRKRRRERRGGRVERTCRKREVLYTVRTVMHVRDMFMVYIYMCMCACVRKTSDYCACILITILFHLIVHNTNTCTCI